MQQEAAVEQAGVPVGAGFGERLVAYLIDFVILLVVQFVVAIIVNDQLVTSLISLLIGLGYVIGFWTTSGATPGKMAMGLRVVDAQTGETIDAGKAIIRYIGYILSSIPIGLGFLWIIWDDKREGWHDKIAKTRVVKTR